ncbi:MAG TPA: hypothetical protein VHD39_06915 [Acidimicrobiales bacterium]|nr:hypothetical protein [Acidimicrobiales bacterium]
MSSGWRRGVAATCASIAGLVACGAAASAATPKTLPTHVVSVQGAGRQGIDEARSGHWMRTVSVTIRVREPLAADVDCRISLRDGGKVIGSSGLRGAIPGGGVTIRVGTANLHTPVKKLRASAHCTALPTPGSVPSTVPMARR